MLDAIKNIRRTKNARRVVAKAADLFEAEPEDGDSIDEEVYFNNSCQIGGICKVCLEGALLIYAKDRATYYTAYKLVRDYLNEEMHEEIEHLFSFNDAFGTGVNDVVKVLRGAATRKK